MNMRDKIAAVIVDEMVDSMGDYSCVADAILAALPGMIPDLVWVRDSAGGDTYSGLYEIYNGAYAEWHCVHSTSSPSRIAHGVSRDRAKAAANAHNRAAIAQAAGWTL
jgi:hypothetical protein